MFCLLTWLFCIGARIQTITVVATFLVEVLPFVTTHDVEVVSIVEILHVLSVSIEHEVVLFALVPTVPTIVCVGRRLWSDNGCFFTLREVTTQVHVQAKIFETVYFIIEFCITDECLGIGILVLLFEQSYWVLGCQ